MRIAICTDQYLPLLSGIADSIEIVAEQLRERGHTVRIYAPDMPNTVPNENIMRLPSYALGPASAGIAINLPVGALQDMRRFKPDVIHAHTAGTIGLFALYASRRLAVPLVGTDHTFPADYLHYIGLKYTPLKWGVRKLSSWYYNRCKFVTAPSKSMLDELIAYGCRAPMRVISNHVSIDIFRPLNKTTMKQKYGVADRAVLVFGRIAIEKNLDAALAVFEKIAATSDAHLLFVGDGPYRSALENRVLKGSLANRIHFLGGKRGEELVEIINTADVLLITSCSETQSMTAIQGMACELPVVAAKRGGLPEYVHDGTTGYVVEPENIDLFAERVFKLLENSEEARRLGEAGRESVRLFSPKNITAQFEEIYGTVSKDT